MQTVSPPLLAFRSTWLALLTWGSVSLLFSAAAVGDDLSPRARVEFNRDVRPILSDHCFACHGPDQASRQADLRLDTEEGLRGRDDQPGVVIPLRPDDGELYRRITSARADERMPPDEFGKPLSPEQIDLIRRWIEQGAHWEGHWSFQPVRREEPPQTQIPRESPVHPIDAFILDELRLHGLEPAPQADRRTLIRRLSFDLTGLPPTPEQVERFVADESPAAYEQLVDELLTSPRYGERMAVWWLDLVRYADSVGYHGDQPVSVFPYREYVIRSFHENKPFDEFTIEQLAGDLLPEPTREQLVASGYNRLGMMSAEGGVQDREYLAKYIAERVRNLGGTWMGITLGCCECHDHKYDPFTMRDFYSLEAFFADIRERGLYAGANSDGNWGPYIQVPTAEQAAQMTEFDRRLEDLRRLLDTQTPELDQAQADWEASRVPWTVLHPSLVISTQGTTLVLHEDGSILATGDTPDTDTYILTVPVTELADSVQVLTALRLDVLPHESLPQQGPGRADNGNFVLSEVEVYVVTDESGQEPVRVTLQNASATYEQTGAAGNNPYGKWAVAAAIDGDEQGPTWGWAVMEQVGRPNSAIFEMAEELTWTAGTELELRIVLKQNLDHPRHTLGHFRLFITGHPRPVNATELPPHQIEALLNIPHGERNDDQRAQLAAYHRSITPLLESARSEQLALEAARKALDAAIPTTLVTEAVEPRTIRILPRGNWMDDSGEVLLPGFPEVLSPPQSVFVQDSRRLNRLDLARWLVEPDHPLTARVFVNRVWKLLFGAGLTRRLDDLGSQGDWPSHPQLLDWLAAEFRDSGWNVKHLVKLIVMSETYQRSSRQTESVREVDPDNRWLSHQSPFRLDAEFVRDNALAVSGLLVEQIGGPSVFPYQPPGYWSYLNFPTREWQNSSGDALYRRGLYTHWQRQYLHPSLAAFDAPSREECIAERSRSNTPLQSLVLLNDPIYTEAARYFAQSLLLADDHSPEDRLDLAFRRALARPVRPAELEVLTTLLERHRQEYTADPESARALLAVGEKLVDPAIDPIELAAWTSVTRVILNLHETITRN